jgi:hypothetical protein
MWKTTETSMNKAFHRFIESDRFHDSDEEAQKEQKDEFGEK